MIGDNISFEYFKKGNLPNNKSLATQLKKRMLCYAFISNTSYHRSFEQMWLRCLAINETKKVIPEIHEELYGAHQSGLKMTLKIKNIGYYWSSMVRDC